MYTVVSHPFTESGTQRYLVVREYEPPTVPRFLVWAVCQTAARADEIAAALNAAAGQE